jgi:hypothetical protein
MSQDSCDVAKIAREYIATRYPFFDPTGLRLVVSEMESQWEVTYLLPRDTLGGAPVLGIDKRTCAVIRAHLTQ